MSRKIIPLRECPLCGHFEPKEIASRELALWPCLLRGRSEIKRCVEGLGEEAREWLFALYIDSGSKLLAADRLVRGDVGSCYISFRKIIERGRALNAAGYILVHNQPSGDPMPSQFDVELTQSLMRTSADMEMPMIDHLIIAGDRMFSVGVVMGAALDRRPEAR